MTYDEAYRYLQGGRKKWIRPLYDRGLYIYKIDKFGSYGTDLGINWRRSFNPNYHMVRIHKDNTMTIEGQPIQTNWGMQTPLRSQSVRYTIWKYAGIQVNIRKGKIHLTEANAGRTPTKIQKCRTCKGSGKVDSSCSPSICHCDDKEHEQYKNNIGRMWHYIPCEHGNATHHWIPKGQDCWYCAGTGKRNYGNKLITVTWDGSPLKVENGNIWTPGQSDSENELERAMKEYVKSNGV
jgi:hypothetical protein